MSRRRQQRISDKAASRKYGTTDAAVDRTGVEEGIPGQAGGASLAVTRDQDNAFPMETELKDTHRPSAPNDGTSTATLAEPVAESPVDIRPPGYEDRDVLLAVRNLVKEFPVRGGGIIRRVVAKVQAVSDVTFDIYQGETLGVVGESGCGKSTLGRTLLQLLPATSGSVQYSGRELTTLKGDALRKMRRDIQIVFQDPYASLNPRLPVAEIVGEPLKIHGLWKSKAAGKARVQELMRLVGLNPEHANRYPHEFSGGQRQRVGVARALALEPNLLVLDEPVSALDVSIQAGVINLLEDLQERMNLSYMFIAHDLSVVRHISDRVAVMYLGKMVEVGTRKQIYEEPAHPYTQALLSAVPVPDPKKERARRRRVLDRRRAQPGRTRRRGAGSEPGAGRPRTSAPKRSPMLVDRGNGHPVACHFAEVEKVV